MTLKQVIECNGCPTVIEFEGDVELGPLMKKLEWTMSDSGKTHLCSSCSSGERPSRGRCCRNGCMRCEQ